MGKWDTINTPPDFDAKLSILKELPAEELDRLWIEAGGRTLMDYGLSWYWSSTNDWSCIDDSTTTKVFRIFFNYRTSTDPILRERANKIAYVLAYQLGMKLAIPPEADKPDGTAAKLPVQVPFDLPYLKAIAWQVQQRNGLAIGQTVRDQAELDGLHSCVYDPEIDTLRPLYPEEQVVKLYNDYIELLNALTSLMPACNGSSGLKKLATAATLLSRLAEESNIGQDMLPLCESDEVKDGPN